MIPKHQYVRSRKLLKLITELPCQHCGAEHMVQAAHSNWGGGKGRGVKADDNLVAALCLSCHYEIDQGRDLSRQERQKMWLNAHHRTIDALRDCWPIDIPLPDAKI